MARWTTQQVIELAPDDRARRAARSLARPGPWSGLGSTETLVWGKCQGSGSSAYQVSVDLIGPAFRCSCPSRKFPCKHALALLMLWVDGEGSVADVGDAPAYAAEWADSRATRAVGAADGAEKKPVDPEAQAKRAAQRRSLMTAGLEDFERWMGDLVRRGLADARHQPYAFWDDAAARLVDAQVPGLAERVRDMGSAVHACDDWADHLLAELGRWFLATRAWHRWDDLDAATRGDLRVVLGWPVPGDEVLSGERVRDQWLVTGVHRTDDGRLQAQRTWLLGQRTQRWALVLDFAVSGGTLRVPQTTGAVFDAELALYPGTEPRRARFVDEPLSVQVDQHRFPLAADIHEVTDQLVAISAANPWVARTPAVVRALAVSTDADDHLVAVDAGGCAVPIAEDVNVWVLLGLLGGQPATLFVEWEHGVLRPLAAFLEDGVLAL